MFEALDVAGTSGNPSGLIDKGGDACTTNNLCNECEGDCDNDNQCAGSLRCFQRDGAQNVPGCGTGGTSGWDYCI